MAVTKRSLALIAVQPGALGLGRAISPSLIQIGTMRASSVIRPIIAGLCSMMIGEIHHDFEAARRSYRRKPPKARRTSCN